MATGMNKPVPITAALNPDDEARARAFETYLSRELRDFAARNGAPGSIALVILSDVDKTPLSYSVLSWTPGGDRPTKVVVQSTAAALLHASIAADFNEARTS